MRIAVITRHAVSNYGSLLQAIATQKVVENLGHSCEIIDYIREDESYRQLEKTLLNNKSDWNNNPLKRMIYLAIRLPESIAAGKRFEREQREYLNLTDRCSNLKQLEKLTDSADVFVTGSDQVWGPVADGSYDSAYCLSFTDKKKIAYAASFGRTDMNEELGEYYNKWLSKYEHIAVREDSAVEVLSDFGITAKQVLDPTLLLDSDYWSQYLKPVKHKRYVLVYQLHNDSKLSRYAERVAEDKGLPLVRVSAAFHQISRAGKLVWCPDIGEFLSYVKNADCMITDSFHGTAFAINFNTPFVEVLPNNKTGTRNMSILRLTGLTNRILNDEDNLSLAGEPIDFTYSNEVIGKLRKSSIDVLRRMIEE